MNLFCLENKKLFIFSLVLPHFIIEVLDALSLDLGSWKAVYDNSRSVFAL